MGAIAPMICSIAKSNPAKSAVDTLSAQLKIARAELPKVQRTKAKVDVLEVAIAKTRALLAEVLPVEVAEETLAKVKLLFGSLLAQCVRSEWV